MVEVGSFYWYLYDVDNSFIKNLAAAFSKADFVNTTFLSNIYPEIRKAKDLKNWSISPDSEIIDIDVVPAKKEDVDNYYNFEKGSFLYYLNSCGSFTRYLSCTVMNSDVKNLIKLSHSFPMIVDSWVHNDISKSYS